MLFLGWVAACAGSDHAALHPASDPTSKPALSAVNPVHLAPPPLLPATDDILAALGSGGYSVDDLETVADAVRSVTVREGVKEIYIRSGGTFLWFDGGQLTRAGRDVVAIMNTCEDHGLQARAVKIPLVTNLIDALEWNKHMLLKRQVGAQDYMGLVRLRGLIMAQLDSQLTATALTLARMLQQTSLSGDRLADALPDPNELNAWVDSLLPWHPQYRRLMGALARYRRYVREGGFPKVVLPEGYAELVEEVRSDTVVTLRERLGAEGFLSGPPTGHKDAIDKVLQQDVRAFQYSRGLAGSGIVDKATVDALNVSAGQLVNRVQQAMKAWRSSQTRTEHTFVQVNLPEFMVELYHFRERLQRSRAVIGYSYGTGGGRTKKYHSTVSEIVINPGWSPSESIVRNEIMAKEWRNKGYMARKGFQWITRRDGSRRLYQRPGPQNALGSVVMRFRNPNNIYLHGSPNRDQFAKAKRAWSHGCVRVQDMEALAFEVLDLNDLLTLSQFKEQLAAGKTIRHPLTTPVPIHFEYILTVVDDDDTVRFLPNIYRL
jgi:murein L,D-transpeptidase YcbB/YkuD